MMTKKRRIALRLVQLRKIYVFTDHVTFQYRGMHDDEHPNSKHYLWLIKKGYVRIGNYGTVELSAKGREYLLGLNLWHNS